MNNFLELTDQTIVNVDDIILVNVDRDWVRYDKDGKPVYDRKLYLRGKGMTLRLTEEDYNIIRKRLLENG